MKKYQSLGSKVLMVPVKELQVDEDSGLSMVGKIYLPKTSTLQNAEGTPIIEFRVLSAGPECKLVRDGMIVLANGLIAEKVMLGEKSVARIDEGSLIAIVSGE